MVKVGTKVTDVATEVDGAFEVKGIVECRAAGMQLHEAVKLGDSGFFVALLVECVGGFDLCLLGEHGTRCAAFEFIVVFNSFVIIVSLRSRFGFSI